MDYLDSCSECESEDKDKSKLNESLVEILQTVDLKAVQEEIQSGFQRQVKEPTTDSEKAKQIAKIRAKLRRNKKGVA